MDYTTNATAAPHSRGGAPENNILTGNSAPALDALSHASSHHPSTGTKLHAAAKLKGAKVRKVQSSAFVQGLGNHREPSIPTNKLTANVRINQNSGTLHHAPKMTNQMNGGSTNSFKLTDAAYKKLMSNLTTTNMVGVQSSKMNKRLALSSKQKDVRSQNSALQHKFDEVSRGGGPNAIQLHVQEQIRPHTGAGMSTQQSSGMHFTNLGGGSVKRGSRNTLQAHLTLDSSMTGVDPRLAMYNKETIKNHLEKRRQRRAVSNIRPRQRFSTITAFHKNDVVAVSNQQQHEEGINSAGNLRCQNATAYWANVNLNLEQKVKNVRSYPIQGFSTGPAYSIPAQHYPGRVSPDKTPRMGQQRAASTASPRQDGLASQRTVSPMSDRASLTPGCTDYTPRHDKLLRQEPTYAPQRAQRFYHHCEKESLSNRPHVYEDPNQRTFRRSNSGSFSRAKRFNGQVDTMQIKAYLMTLKSSKASRQHSMGNLGARTMIAQGTKSHPKFVSSEGNSASVTEGIHYNEKPDVVSRARPSTEAGRMRARRATEPTSPHGLDGSENEDQYAQSSQKNRSIKKSQMHTICVQGSSRMHTPRFSMHQRNQTTSFQSVDGSTIEATPGPACYETRVNSCVRTPHKQMTFTTASRWGSIKPAANPAAPLYDTRPSSWLLHKMQPRVRIAEAKREISPTLFHAKNSIAVMKGVFLKP